MTAIGDSSRLVWLASFRLVAGAVCAATAVVASGVPIVEEFATLHYEGPYAHSSFGRVWVRDGVALLTYTDFGPSDRRLAPDQSFGIQVYDAPTGELIRQAQLGASGWLASDFDGQTFVTADASFGQPGQFPLGEVIGYSLPTVVEQFRAQGTGPPGPSSLGREVAVDGKDVLVGGAAGTYHFDVSAPGSLQPFWAPLEGEPQASHVVEFSLDHGRAVVSGRTGRSEFVSVVDLDSGQWVSTLDLPPEAVSLGARFKIRGDRVLLIPSYGAEGHRNGYVFDAVTGQLVSTLVAPIESFPLSAAHDAGVTGFDLDTEQAVISHAGVDSNGEPVQAVLVYDLQSGKPVADLRRGSPRWYEGRSGAAVSIDDGIVVMQNGLLPPLELGLSDYEATAYLFRAPVPEPSSVVGLCWALAFAAPCLRSRQV